VRGITFIWREAWVAKRLVRWAIRAALVVALTLGGIVAAAAQAFTITVLPNTIPAATQGQFYSQTMDAAGGNTPYSFAVTSGSLPAGITLSSAGILSGTSNAPGSYNFTITATDVDGNTGFRPYTFSMGAAGGVTVNPASLPAGSVGVGYSQNITTIGGTGSGRVFSISAGALPTGLSINAGTGTISGTPTTGGSFGFTVQVRDSGGNTGTRAYSVDIGDNILTLSHPAPNGALTVPYNYTVTANNGTGPYTFALIAGALPNGLSLGAGGGITGTPTVAGAFNFTLRATDSVNNVGSQAFTVNIGANILTVTPPTLPNGTRNVAYSQNFGATGGTGTYTFARTSGALPPGMSLTNAGLLSGTPTSSGTFNFDIQATDTNFNTGTTSYALVINPAPLTINPPTLPAGTAGTAYNSAVVASGGNGNYSYTVLSGALPTGLTLGAGGAITGTPTVPGSYAFTIQATDTSPNTGTRNYTIDIGTANSLTLAPTTLPNGTNGTAYNQTVTASGAVGSVSFALVSGALPAGLSISSGGVISGTPNGSGLSTFTVGATDSAGNTGSQLYNVNIGTSALTVTPATLPAGTRNIAYSQNVGATGGTGGPYTFTISGGALPAGLTMNSAGLISGTPTTAGPASFTVRALDGLGNFGTRLYSVNIGTVTLTVNPATLPDAVFGRPYSQTVFATGGTAPYTYLISAGALPPGLSLNTATGVISGSPTNTGNDTFTVQARDVNGDIGSRSYTLDPRPDPALDPEVQGLIAAQVASAQRFASAQVTNVSHHLESLHENFTPCSFNFGLAPPMDRGQQQQPGAIYYQDPNSLYAPGGKYGNAPVIMLPPGYGPPPGYTAHQLPPGQQPPGQVPCAAEWASSMSFWTSGSFQFGSLTPSGVASGNKFTTGGLTAGADYRVSDKLIIGASLGYGADHSDVGQNGSRSDGTSFSGALYASLRLFNPVFIDGAIGYGTLGYDNRRWVTGDGSTVSGNRTGSYWFGSLTASLELGRGRVKFAPYVGTDFMSATLNSYSESGPSTQLLTYNSMKFNALSGLVGLRGSVDMPMSFGTFTPTARLEYRQSSQSSFDQSMYYSDLGAGSSSTFSQASGKNGMTTGAVGFRARAIGGLAFEVEYGLTQGTSSLHTQSLRASVKMPF
jgi:uncharacterized protein YhjY with autotransporter beta-barrel domain